MGFFQDLENVFNEQTLAIDNSNEIFSDKDTILDDSDDFDFEDLEAMLEKEIRELDESNKHILFHSTGSKYGITNIELLDLKKFNIIIGKNGAGKTRLLKAIKDSITSMNTIVIYAYFPDMNTHFNIDISNKTCDIPLYELIFENQNIELDNFIQYIELQGYDFLLELLRDITQNSRYAKSYRKERAKNIQAELNNILGSLINRTLIFESDIMVKSNTSKTTKKLTDSLKQMSPGELSLFYLSILLIFIKYNKHDNSEIVVLLDEPELHLHPDALIKFVNYLKAEESINICCIATHSIFLVPLLDFYEIIYIENSKIQPHNSKMYCEIFDNIVGKHENIVDYLISRDMWQYYNFIADCFCLPNVVDKVDKKDEQFVKFVEHINQIKKIRNFITVLDYGAGSGRLGKIIKTAEESIEKKVKYFYYDKYEKNPPTDLGCPIYKDLQDIYSTNQKFDCVVLMNVLHEIDVKEWLQTFQSIYNILEPNGYLLIFEVISLLHGEQPYGDTGYILLGEQEIDKLFKTNGKKSYSNDSNKKTNTFIIKRELLRNVNSQSIMDALLTLKENISIQLREQYEIRRKHAHNNEKPSRQLIKNYGFLSQHYFNSMFAIERMQNLYAVENTSNTTKNNKGAHLFKI